MDVNFNSINSENTTQNAPLLAVTREQCNFSFSFGKQAMVYASGNILVKYTEVDVGSSLNVFCRHNSIKRQQKRRTISLMAGSKRRSYKKRAYHRKKK